MRFHKYVAMRDLKALFLVSPLQNAIIVRNLCHVAALDPNPHVVMVVVAGAAAVAAAAAVVVVAVVVNKVIMIRKILGTGLGIWVAVVVAAVVVAVMVDPVADLLVTTLAPAHLAANLT